MQNYVKTNRTAYLDRIIIHLLSTYVFLLWFSRQMGGTLPITIHLYNVISISDAVSNIATPDSQNCPKMQLSVTK